MVSFLGTCPTSPHTFLSITQEPAKGGEMAGPVAARCCQTRSLPVQQPVSAELTRRPSLCRMAPGTYDPSSLMEARRGSLRLAAATRRVGTGSQIQSRAPSGLLGRRAGAQKTHPRREQDSH